MAFTSNVSSGMVVEGQIVSSGTSQRVSSGGITRSSIIRFGGYHVIISGGSAYDTVVSSGGRQNVGGYAYGTVISGGGTQVIYQGGVAETTTLKQGDQVIEYGGIALGTIMSGGYQYVRGGVTSNTIINNGIEYISAGGVTVNTQINSGGRGEVSSGGVANGTILNGGNLVCSRGGVTNSTVVISGYLAIRDGVANSAVVSSGGGLWIAYGSATDFTIMSGGSIGWDFNTVVSGTSNGVTLVNSGGKYSSNWNVGIFSSQHVLSGYIANDTVVSSSGVQMVSEGGVAYRTQVVSGGSQVVFNSGNIISTLVGYDGLQEIKFGGIGTATTITALGVAIVRGEVSSSLVIGGRQELCGGFAYNTFVSNGGVQYISNGVAYATGLKGGGNQFVARGGSSINTIISSGGLEILGSNSVSSSVPSILGGYSLGAIISSGGRQEIFNSGLVSSSTIMSRGLQYVHEGGSAVAAVIFSGGSQIISSGGVADHSTISGGRQIVREEGLTTDTSICFGGILTVSSGGSAYRSMINSGGFLNVLEDSWVESAVVNYAGSMHVATNGNATGDLTLDGGVATFEQGDALKVSSLNFILTNARSNRAMLNFNSGSSPEPEYISYSLTLDGANYDTYILISGEDLANQEYAEFNLVYSGDSTNLSVGNSHVFDDGSTITLALNNDITDTVTALWTAREVLPVISVTATDAVAGEPSDTGTFRITRTGDTTSALIVNYTLGGTASAGNDYTLKNGAVSLNGAVTIAAGQSYVDITLNPVDDNLIEAVESAILTLSANTAYTLGSTSSATVNISSNDINTVTIAATDAVAGEPSDTGTFRITRTGDTTSALIVNYTLGGTATAGNDYTLKNGAVSLSGAVTIAAGQSYVDITLNPVDDNLIEAVESAILTLSANAAYTLGSTSSATVNISSNDINTVTIAATDAVAGEPSDTGTFRITRTGDTTSALIVNYTLGGTATAGNDYTLKNGAVSLSGAVTIAAGQSYVDITLNPVDDNLIEAVESAILTLSANAAYTLGSTSSATVNISSNDINAVTIAATDAAAGEPSDTGTFRITRTGDTTSALIVNYTLGGTASAGTDYTLKNGVVSLNGAVTIAAGQSYVDITLTPIDDNLIEGSETATIILSSSPSYEILVNDIVSSIVTIADNDQEIKDITAPTIPTGLLRDTSIGKVTLSWSSSSDSGSGVAGYNVQIDNNADFSSPEYAGFITGVTCSYDNLAKGSYYWRIQAKDNSNNLSNWSNGTTFLFNNGSGDNSSYKLFFGHFSGGETDGIMKFNTETSHLEICKNNKFEALAETGSGWDVVATGDLNGDGYDDILIANEQYNVLGAWTMNGDGSYGWMNVASLPMPEWQVKGVVDFDGNGVDDILLYWSEYNYYGAWLLDDIGNTYWRGFGQIADGWEIGGTGDFNGDNREDIYLLNEEYGVVGSWLMNDAANGITWQTVGSYNTAIWDVVGTGDFDGNGVDDVLLRWADLNYLGAWELDGAGNTSGWASFGQYEAGSWNISGIADVNGDGTDDIVMGAAGSDYIGARLINNGMVSGWMTVAT